MTETAKDATRTLRQNAPSDAEIDAALLEVAAAVEQRAEQIAARMVRAFVAELPAYRDAPPDLLAEMHEHSLGIVLAGLKMLREDRTSLCPEEREVLVELGRTRAEQGFPLHAVVQSYHIGAKILLDQVLADVLPRGPLAGPLLARALRLTLAVVNEAVSVVTDTYVEARRDIGGRRDQAAQELLSDLLLGASPARAATSAAGLAPAPGYAAVAATRGGGIADDPSLRTRLDHALPGSAWGVHGGALVVIVPVPADRPDAPGSTAEKLMDAVRSELGEDVLVGIGRVHDGVDGIRRSFADVLAVHGIGRRLGLRGCIHYRDVLAHRLVASAPETAKDLTEVLEPLVRHDTGGELLRTLRAYLDSGLSLIETGRALGLHRNSVAARIRRIEQLLGEEVERRRFLLELALTSHEVQTTGDDPPGERRTDEGQTRRISASP
jgi:hypothetical protein